MYINLLSKAQGWFAVLLVVMIVVTALFGLILFIALRPIKKDELSENSAQKKLKRRETELTIKLLETKNDKQASDKLIDELRQVKSAETLVDSLMEDGENSPESGNQEAPKHEAAPKATKIKPVSAPKAAKAKPAPEASQVKPEQEKSGNAAKAESKNVEEKNNT